LMADLVGWLADLLVGGRVSWCIIWAACWSVGWLVGWLVDKAWPIDRAPQDRL